MSWAAVWKGWAVTGEARGWRLQMSLRGWCQKAGRAARELLLIGTGRALENAPVWGGITLIIYLHLLLVCPHQGSLAFPQVRQPKYVGHLWGCERQETWFQRKTLLIFFSSPYDLDLRLRTREGRSFASHMKKKKKDKPATGNSA